MWRDFWSRSGAETALLSPGKVKRLAIADADGGLPDPRLAAQNVDTPTIEYIRRHHEAEEARLLREWGRRTARVLKPLRKAAMQGERPARPFGRGPDAREAHEAGLKFDRIREEGETAVAEFVGYHLDTQGRMMESAAR